MTEENQENLVRIAGLRIRGKIANLSAVTFGAFYLKAVRNRDYNVDNIVKTKVESTSTE
jgi:hypothetical protein